MPRNKKRKSVLGRYTEKATNMRQRRRRDRNNHRTSAVQSKPFQLLGYTEFTSIKESSDTESADTICYAEKLDVEDDDDSTGTVAGETVGDKVNLNYADNTNSGGKMAVESVFDMTVLSDEEGDIQCMSSYYKDGGDDMDVSLRGTQPMSPFRASDILGIMEQRMSVHSCSSVRGTSDNSCISKTVPVNDKTKSTHKTVEVKNVDPQVICSDETLQVTHYDIKKDPSSSPSSFVERDESVMSNYYELEKNDSVGLYPDALSDPVCQQPIPPLKRIVVSKVDREVINKHRKDVQKRQSSRLVFTESQRPVSPEVENLTASHTSFLSCKDVPHSSNTVRGGTVDQRPLSGSSQCSTFTSFEDGTTLIPGVPDKGMSCSENTEPLILSRCVPSYCLSDQVHFQEDNPGARKANIPVTEEIRYVLNDGYQTEEDQHQQANIPTVQSIVNRQRNSLQLNVNISLPEPHLTNLSETHTRTSIQVLPHEKAPCSSMGVGYGVKGTGFGYEGNSMGCGNKRSVGFGNDVKCVSVGNGEGVRFDSGGVNLGFDNGECINFGSDDERGCLSDRLECAAFNSSGEYQNVGDRRGVGYRDEVSIMPVRVRFTGPSAMMFPPPWFGPFLPPPGQFKHMNRGPRLNTPVWPFRRPKVCPLPGLISARHLPHVREIQRLDNPFSSETLSPQPTKRKGKRNRGAPTPAKKKVVQHDDSPQNNRQSAEQKQSDCKENETEHFVGVQHQAYEKPNKKEILSTAGHRRDKDSGIKDRIKSRHFKEKDCGPGPKDESGSTPLSAFQLDIADENTETKDRSSPVSAFLSDTAHKNSGMKEGSRHSSLYKLVTANKDNRTKDGSRPVNFPQPNTSEVPEYANCPLEFAPDSSPTSTTLQNRLWTPYALDNRCTFPPKDQLRQHNTLRNLDCSDMAIFRRCYEKAEYRNPEIYENKDLLTSCSDNVSFSSPAVCPTENNSSQSFNVASSLCPLGRVGSSPPTLSQEDKSFVFLPACKANQLASGADESINPLAVGHNHNPISANMTSSVLSSCPNDDQSKENHPPIGVKSDLEDNYAQQTSVPLSTYASSTQPRRNTEGVLENVENYDQTMRLIAEDILSPGDKVSNNTLNIMQSLTNMVQSAGDEQVSVNSNRFHLVANSHRFRQVSINQQSVEKGVYTQMIPLLSTHNATDHEVRPNLSTDAAFIQQKNIPVANLPMGDYIAGSQKPEKGENMMEKFEQNKQVFGPTLNAVVYMKDDDFAEQTLAEWPSHVNCVLSSDKRNFDGNRVVQYDRERLYKKSESVSQKLDSIHSELLSINKRERGEFIVNGADGNSRNEDPRINVKIEKNKASIENCKITSKNQSVAGEIYKSNVTDIFCNVKTEDKSSNIEMNDRAVCREVENGLQEVINQSLLKNLCNSDTQVSVVGHRNSEHTAIFSSEDNLTIDNHANTSNMIENQNKQDSGDKNVQNLGKGSPTIEDSRDMKNKNIQESLDEVKDDGVLTDVQEGTNEMKEEGESNTLAKAMHHWPGRVPSFSEHKDALCANFFLESWQIFSEMDTDENHDTVTSVATLSSIQEKVIGPVTVPLSAAQYTITQTTCSISDNQTKGEGECTLTKVLPTLAELVTGKRTETKQVKPLRLQDM